MSRSSSTVTRALPWTLTILVGCLLPFTGCGRKSGPGPDFGTSRIQGVRFDPSYYYNLRQPLRNFVDSAVGDWRSHGINTVFFKAYDAEFGAVYGTKYPGNRKTDYGDKDLLRLFLDASHKRGMRVLAWMPVFEHKGAWDAHPEWRLKTRDGADLMPLPDHHFLCARRPGFAAWWQGFLKDILDRYPDLDGMDFAEPAAVWKGKLACQCDICRKEIGAGGRDMFSPEAAAERARGLTDLLLASTKAVKAAGRTACVTFIATAAPSSDLLPFARQKELTGLDLDRMLDSPDRPQWVSAELLWQQWADSYDNPATFRPEWTRKAVEQSLAQVGTRAHLIAHIELTPLGPVEVSPNELVESIVAARRGGAQSIEFYDTHLADSMGAWSNLEKAWNTQSERRVLVLHDPRGLGVAKQVAVLFGHFGLETVTAAVDSFSDTLVGANDLVAYVGSKENYPLPAAFLAWAAEPESKLFWADFNLWQLDRPLTGGHGDTNTYRDTAKGIAAAPSNGVLARRGLKFEYLRHTSDYNTVLYGGQELYKTDSVFNQVAVLDTAKVKVHARVRSRDGETHPYILQSGNFWFVADCPTDYIVEGGRDAAFADVLHEFVGESHPVKRTALVRIEDVCPLTDPASIRAIADLLHGQGVPFSISLVTYYVDPDENTALTLSDRPEFVKAIKYAMSKGAAIVMHGSTHQYRGRSTYDYEFWDALHDSPLFEDSKEYVRVRLQRGIDEMRKNGIYPIVFETPHYACSQLDYGVIDQFFSAEYGRRQVIDQTGFDQLVPFFIARHPSGNSIIPENLGYVPNDLQDAAPLLRFAKNNLAVRDGFASFFFHPWIDRKVLKELVTGVRAMGYEFSDIRSLPLKMEAQGIVHVTGSREISLNPQGKYLRTFYLDSQGEHREEWVSKEPVTGAFAKAVHCPPGWSFVAEATEKPPGWLSDISMPKLGVLGKARDRLLSSPVLRASQGKPARPCLIWTVPGSLPPAWPDTSAADSQTASAAPRRAAHLHTHPGGTWPPRDPVDSVEPARPASKAAYARPKPPAIHFPASQEAWARAFQAFGIDVDTLRVDRFLGVPDANNLVVIPAEAAALLSTQQSLILSQWVAKGNALILEGPSLMAERLGIRTTDSGKTVSELKDDYLPQVDIKWAKPSPYYVFDADVEYVNEYSTADDAPLVAGGEYGEGKYLFFAVPFTAADEPAKPYRFPFLLDLVEREFGLFPTLKSPSLEVYFDPGSREDVPVEQLAANWHKNGVRAVYVAGWHDYQKYTFEYGYLADLLHKYGILAYAWFDLPGISDRFWQDHPQWREKTAAGTDAEMEADIGWKQSMNLTNDTCRAGAYNALKRLLLLAPWDGAALTGRMFSGDNPDSLKHITPFHPSFRARYAADRGYDPARIFDPAAPQYFRKSPAAWNAFRDYRDSVELALTVDAIAFLKEQRPLQKPGAEIILTRSLEGVSPRTAAWYRGLTENDPQVRLQAAPTRTALGAEELLKDLAVWRADYPAWKPMVEIQFDKRKPASGSTSQLCGLELMDLVASAELAGARLTLRTEDFIYDTDFRDLAYAAAAAARERITPAAWTIDAPGRTALELDEHANPEVLVDGNIWPAYDKGRLLLPEGSHRVEGCPRLMAWKTLLQAPARITGFNGDIVEAGITLKGLHLRYRSPLPASLGLSMVPRETSLDGLPLGRMEADKTPMPKSAAAGAGAKGMVPGGSLSLPAGDHLVEITMRPLFSSIMRQASIGLSGVIVVISSLTVFAFVLLYLGGAAKRLYSGDGGDEGKSGEK
ncbi:MAG: hypothetical protein JWO30_1315 [Fibrobacteres bacterium]|nr:hypothetical protein [Fibrobacterota bacterium]